MPGSRTRAAEEAGRGTRRRSGRWSMLGVGAALAVTIGLSACGSSSTAKITPGGSPSAGTTTPSTSAPRGGGVSY